MRPPSRGIELAGVLLVLAGCTAAGPDATGPDATGPPPAGAPAPARPAPGRVSVEVFTDRSEVTTGGSDVGRSAVEVRIDEILSEFDTRRTPEGSVVTLPEQVLFDFDSAALEPRAGSALDRIAEALTLAGDRRVTIRGHTDSRGDDAYNLGLSQRRADAVLEYFVAAGSLDAARFVATGLGESRPVAANERPDGSDDPDGRQRNRRVEIVLEGP